MSGARASVTRSRPRRPGRRGSHVRARETGVACARARDTGPASASQGGGGPLEPEAAQLLGVALPLFRDLDTQREEHLSTK